MSVDDVLKVIPQSIPTPSNDQMPDGAVKLVTGPPQTIDAQTYIPKFYFLQGRLDQVILTLSDVNDQTKAQLIFHSLANFLKAKYGTELIAQDPDFEALFSFGVRQWIVSGTNITVFLAFVRGANNPILNISYSRHPANNPVKP